MASLVACALAVACSRSEPAWPARNYSGVYTVQALSTSSSCPAPVFAPGDTLVFTLVQTAQNHARVDIPPVASVAGRFTGDALEGYGAVAAGPEGTPPPAGAAHPPASTAAAGTGPDSIRYRLALQFRGHGFEGTYRVEQPALGQGVAACSQVFDVAGTEVPGGLTLPGR
ncbi:MAG TPA: hypothetical protein VIC59_11715 [Gemmatimonadota bacterium]|jgi:hypothetical protein